MRKILVDGREALILPQFYTVKLVVGQVGSLGYDNGW